MAEEKGTIFSEIFQEEFVSFNEIECALEALDSTCSNQDPVTDKISIILEGLGNFVRSGGVTEGETFQFYMGRFPFENDSNWAKCVLCDAKCKQ